MFEGNRVRVSLKQAANLLVTPNFEFAWPKINPAALRGCKRACRRVIARPASLNNRSRLAVLAGTPNTTAAKLPSDDLVSKQNSLWKWFSRPENRFWHRFYHGFGFETKKPLKMIFAPWKSFWHPFYHGFGFETQKSPWQFRGVGWGRVFVGTNQWTNVWLQMDFGTQHIFLQKFVQDSLQSNSANFHSVFFLRSLPQSLCSVQFVLLRVPSPNNKNLFVNTFLSCPCNASIVHLDCIVLGFFSGGTKTWLSWTYKWLRKDMQVFYRNHKNKAQRCSICIYKFDQMPAEAWHLPEPLFQKYLYAQKWSKVFTFKSHPRFYR